MKQKALKTKIEFNVFIYNVQDGYTINYETGQATKQKLVAAIRIFMNIMKNCVKHTFKEI